MYKLTYIYRVCFDINLTGFAKKNKFQKSEITREVGGWVGPGLTLNFFWKSSQNSPKSCWLLRFECSVHVSDGFQKKVWIGWVGWALSKFFLWIFGICLTLQSPLVAPTLSVSGFSSNPENDTDLSDNYAAVDVPVRAKVNIRVTG